MSALIKHFVRVSNYAVLNLVNLVRIAKTSTLKTEKNLKSPKLLPVYNSNIKVCVPDLCDLCVCLVCSTMYVCTVCTHVQNELTKQCVVLEQLRVENTKLNKTVQSQHLQVNSLQKEVISDGMN